MQSEMNKMIRKLINITKLINKNKEKTKKHDKITYHQIKNLKKKIQLNIK